MKHALARRRGVSLLEILIAIFVVALGLLGVAALLPAGRFSVIEATKADRSANCGRAAIAEIKIRNMLDPQNLLYANGNPASNVADTGAFVIDPLFLAQNPVFFPHYLANPAYPQLPRVTLRRWPNTNDPTLIDPFVADRVFRWRDDLLFDMDDKDPTRRPRQSVEWFWQDGDGDHYVTAPRPPLTSDVDAPDPTVATALLPSIKGDYSWFATVSPSVSDPTTHRCKFDVSVVVCFARNLTADNTNPSERSMQAGGAGASGGDVELSTPTAVTDPEYLRVRENEWIMLHGQNAAGRLVAKWYRVVAVDEAPVYNTVGANPGWKRRVTLAGPDWDAAAMPNIVAVLIDGVIGVYTKTIELDRDSLWNWP